MKTYRMEKCSHGSTMVEDRFDGEWVRSTEAQSIVGQYHRTLESLLDAVDSVQDWTGTRVGEAIDAARKVVDVEQVLDAAEVVMPFSPEGEAKETIDCRDYPV